MIFYNYKGLFNKNKQEELEEEDAPATAPTFDNRWKWFSIIERLANSDITKFEEVYKVPYITALNTLSYWKEKQDYEDAHRRRQEMMRKHR